MPPFKIRYQRQISADWEATIHVDNLEQAQAFVNGCLDSGDIAHLDLLGECVNEECTDIYIHSIEPEPCPNTDSTSTRKSGRPTRSS